MAKQQQDYSPEFRLLRHVVLIGLMGAGKSSLGKRLAQIIGVPFADADHEIELAANMTIPEIFKSHGEEAFRDVERRVIARIANAKQPTVLATGGGAFMNEQTRLLLLERSTTIWLRAELEVLYSRVAKKGGRPLLENGDPREILSELMEKRHPFYAKAALTIDTRNEPHEASLNSILTALKKRGDLKELS